MTLGLPLSTMYAFLLVLSRVAGLITFLPAPGFRGPTVWLSARELRKIPGGLLGAHCRQSRWHRAFGQRHVFAGPACRSARSRPASAPRYLAGRVGTHATATAIALSGLPIEDAG